MVAFDTSDIDRKVRLQAFQWLAEQGDLYGDLVFFGLYADDVFGQALPVGVQQLHEFLQAVIRIEHFAAEFPSGRIVPAITDMISVLFIVMIITITISVSITVFIGFAFVRNGQADPFVEVCKLPEPGRKDLEVELRRIKNGVVRCKCDDGPRFRSFTDRLNP